MHEPKHQPEYLLQELGAHGLDPAVKERLRAQLSAYADFHAASGASAPARQGVFGWIAGVRWYAPTAALLMFTLLAGGTAYASEKSLPGQALYTVKIRVAEPIEVALATTPEEKAEVHATLAERRLEEVAKLAVQRTLTPETADFLEQNFSEHVDAHLAAADTLAAEGKTDISLDKRSDLEARLVAHADILDLVEDHLEEEADTRAHDATESVLATVKLRQEVVSGTRIALERELADSATATETLALVTKASEAVPQQAKSAAIQSVVEHTAEADAALIEAKEALDEDPDAERAFRKAHEADRASEVVTTLLKHSEILMAITPASTTATTTATTTAATTTPVQE